MEELTELPQIVSGCAEQASTMAEALFGRLGAETIRDSSPLEAELAKIFTNAGATSSSPTANQFYHDRHRLRRSTSTGSRRADPRLPARPGPSRRPASPPARACSRTRCSSRRATTTASSSATRPCSINEGLPNYLVRRAERALAAARDERRHPRHGVQGRERRSARVAVATSSARSSSSRRARCSAPICTIKDPAFVPARGGARSGPTCCSSARRTREYRDLRSPTASPSSTSGTVPACG